VNAGGRGAPGLQVSPPDLGLEPDHRALRSRVLSDSRTDGEQQSAAKRVPGKEPFQEPTRAILRRHEPTQGHCLRGSSAQ
jgi:hypothetical protein